MIRFITSLSLVFVSTITLAQSGESRIHEVYNQQEIQLLKESKTNRYETIRTYAEKGFVLTRVAKEGVTYLEVEALYKSDKVSTWSTDSFLTEIEKDDFNPLSLHWRPGMNRQYYHLKNSNLFFEIPSTKELK